MLRSSASRPCMRAVPGTASGSAKHTRSRGAWPCCTRRWLMRSRKNWNRAPSIWHSELRTGPGVIWLYVCSQACTDAA